MKMRLPAWDGRTRFEYERDGDGSLTLFYGDRFEHTCTLKTPLCAELVRRYKGRTVRLNHCLAEENIEDWLATQGIRIRITQYLAPVLRYERYAREGARRGTITFR